MPKATFHTHVAQVPIGTGRLIARAIRDGGWIPVWSDSFGRLQELDKMIWQYEAESFIPHEIWEMEEAMPSETSGPLACGGNPPRIPEGMNRLEPVRAVFGTPLRSCPRTFSKSSATAWKISPTARERFTAYRRSGFAIEHHGMEGKA